MKKLTSLIALSALSAAAAAEPTLYGKANVSYQLVDQTAASGSESSYFELKSNASRVGIKGIEKLEGSSLELIYNFEYGTEVDGDTGNKTFSQRNIFVGVKGGFGTLKAGKFDSPLKVAQKKVDLFNDLEGDIKNMITENDNRPSNIVGFTSNKLADMITVSVASVASEVEGDDDGYSTSVSFDQSGLYLALAYDKNVEAEHASALRFVTQYNLSDIQLGVLYESAKANDDADSVNGWIVSGKYSVEKLVFKVQFGQSDIKEEDAKALNLGVDYKLSKKAKLFSYFSTNEYLEGADTADNQYLGAGLEVKF